MKKLRVVFDRQEKRLQEAEEEKAALAQKVKKQHSKIKSLSQENKQREKEIYFHRNLLASDLKHVISLQHDIGISADTIQNHLILLNRYIVDDKPVPPDRLKRFVEAISLQNRKIISISKFITKANYNIESSELTSDLIEFIRQYIQNVCKEVMKTYDNRPMGVSFIEINKNETFERRFKPIEITLIIDNLLSNSRKAGASNVYFTSEVISKETLLIRIKDDGKGIPSGNRDRIFEYGFTTTSGSGLGLYHVKDILKSVNGTISLNPDSRNGTEFLIRISR